MTYKAIIKNIIDMKATREAEAIIKDITKKDILLFADYIETAQDIDYGISFEVFASLRFEHVKVTGYIDAYGVVHVCAIWNARGDYVHLLWGCVTGVNKKEGLHNRGYIGSTTAAGAGRKPRPEGR